MHLSIHFISRPLATNLPNVFISNPRPSHQFISHSSWITYIYTQAILPSMQPHGSPKLLSILGIPFHHCFFRANCERSYSSVAAPFGLMPILTVWSRRRQNPILIFKPCTYPDNFFFFFPQMYKKWNKLMASLSHISPYKLCPWTRYCCFRNISYQALRVNYKLTFLQQ